MADGGERQLSVAKRPLGNLPAERRAAIADQVLERYMQGEQVAGMASEFGTSDVTIYALLLRERQDEWKDIQTARALARLETSQDKLSTASDGLSLARAREQVRSAQWELERLLSRLYGQKQEVTHTISDELAARLARAETRTREPIDVTPTAQVSDSE